MHTHQQCQNDCHKSYHMLDETDEQQSDPSDLIDTVIQKIQTLYRQMTNAFSSQWFIAQAKLRQRSSVFAV